MKGCNRPKTFGNKGFNNFNKNQMKGNTFGNTQKNKKELLSKFLKKK